ncbi:SdrD B-like domain-containing protein [Paenibacillus apiarius]|uniref:SdrD B-like domain-containing protein n=1 Tax=Paenibacillus apiarius TaxID=46240 RepID=UPI00197FCBEF|nr:LPXTG cell wall anchor domain-containing protein [Paenibacillus apiarius]
MKFFAPDGYTFTLKDAGGNRALDSNAYKDGWTDIIALAQGEHNMTIDAGLIRKPAEPGPDPDPDRPGGSDRSGNSGGGSSSTNPTTEPGRPSEPSNPGSEHDEPSDVNYPEDNTEGEQDENNDDANDTEVDGGTDSEPNKEEQPKSSPKHTDTLPQTGEDAPVAPVIGAILCTLALVVWLARKKIFAQN